MERILPNASIGVYFSNLHICPFSTSGNEILEWNHSAKIYNLILLQYSKLQDFLFLFFILGYFGIDLRKCCFRNKLQEL